ncbi:MAG TPA: TetR/AcrR family transcriptional regulator [Longimicrobiaceae bacterium]
MARPKEFDPDAALDAAMELFWEHGYEGTSLAMLTGHLGIGRASLYATFGDKRELYRLALQRYLETRGLDPLELLSRPGPVLPAIRQLVHQYVEESIHDASRKGCLVVNTATELLPEDRTMARLVESSWDKLEAALTSTFMRARAQGELAEGVKPQSAARFILTFLQGIRVMAKAPDADRLHDAALVALSLIEP